MKLTGKVGWAIIVLVFPVLGLFTGWLVGVSRESAVNALLPLIFALAGSLSYGILENVLKSRKITNLLETIEDEEVRKIAEATIRPGLTPSLTSPALGLVGCYYFVHLVLWAFNWASTNVRPIIYL